LRNSLILCLLGLFIAALIVAPGCDCDDDGDMDFSDDLDVSCDCNGLTRAIYERCNGEVALEDGPQPASDFSGTCQDALDDGGENGDRFACYIEAACKAEDCEEASERLRLCNR